MAVEAARKWHRPIEWGGQLITRTDLNERINEWGIREDVIEKDYVIGWVLWGIGSDPSLSTSWVFKGGTCLKKCYVETYRFSEDLDFTVLPGGPAEASQVIPLLKGVFEHIYEESGIDFQGREPIVRQRPDGRSAEGANLLPWPTERAWCRKPQARPDYCGTGGASHCPAPHRPRVPPTPCRCPLRCDATALRRLSLRSCRLWEREPGLVTSTT